MHRPCLTCGRPTTGTRCRACTPTASQRGYGSTWARLSRSLIAAEPWCHRPGGCPHVDAGGTTNPLTVDHLTPKSRGGTDDPSNLTVLCRRCNSAKHNR